MYYTLVIKNAVVLKVKMSKIETIKYKNKEWREIQRK